ncbi:MAG: hypothetical protein ACJ71B_02710 [Nitrososphaera sp.]
MLALRIDSSSIVFLSVPFLQLICVAATTTILRVWQEHNIISWKVALAAERPALVLFFLSFVVSDSVITTHGKGKALREKILHIWILHKPQIMNYKITY